MSDNKTKTNGAHNECRFRLASVHLLSAPFHLDCPFDYVIPSDIDVSAGDFVAVPFGGGNRPETALVVNVHEMCENDLQKMVYKPLSRVLDSSLSLSDENLALVEFLRERTFCTTGEAVRTITPSSAFSKLEEYISCIAPLPEYYPECSDEYKLYEFVRNTSNCTKDKVRSAFGQRTCSKILTMLVAENILGLTIDTKDISNIKYSVLYSTTLPEHEINSICFRSEKQRQILEFLFENGTTEQGQLCSELNATPAQIKALVEKGYVKREEIERYRIPYTSEKAHQDVILNDEQNAAVNTVLKLTEVNEPNAALLYGVTGSGKTQVMRAIMEKVIEKGKGVILLVPEISLTPQTIEFFSRSFGERTAVIHSGLSSGERFDAWRRIKKGEVDVCIGTRSAIFAPFDNLGLIVIDEEQEHTYKSDSSPKYNTKEVAAFRCARHGCTMLLASATPSVESYYKAINGVYSLCELKTRYGAGGLPRSEIIDMRTEAKDGNFSLFSQKLVDAMAKTLQDGKQSVLFLNRRGYHSFMNCPSCGEVFMCPHCSVSLTHHFARGSDKGYLLCHYCGYRTHIPEKCPKCKNQNMRFMGYGTQLAQEQLQKLFPNARILRMDADTTSNKFSYDEILTKFKNKEADILLGTQMVTKGHDFPFVTLVGMLSADQSLYVDDYRANERTFSLICQTVGRAGRRDEEGSALIQCYSPEHEVLKVATDQDYKAFYENEIKLRKALLFPPFCDIASVTVTSTDEAGAFSAAGKLLEEIKTLLSASDKDIRMQIFGPFEAPVFKLSEKYRVRLIIKCKNNKNTRALLRNALKKIGETMPKTISVGIDINPTNL